MADLKVTFVQFRGSTVESWAAICLQTTTCKQLNQMRNNYCSYSEHNPYRSHHANESLREP